MSSNNIPNLCFIDNKTNKCADNNYNRVYDNNGTDVYKVNLLNSPISINTKPEQNKSKLSNNNTQPYAHVQRDVGNNTGK
jgi:hypothetical protein